MKVYTLHTSEIDDLSEALSEIAGQLEAIPLLKNTVGILACHYDFVSNGIVSSLSAALPFPVVGFTTFYQATPPVRGLFSLTITVLTSDSVRFAIASSKGLLHDSSPEKTVADAYREAYAVHGAPPALILNFLSTNRPCTGDAYLRFLDAESGGCPSFGAVSTGEDEEGTNVHVLCGGKSLTYGFAMLLLIGEVNTRYYFGHFRTDKLLDMTARVTRADGVRVLELNGRPASEHLIKNDIPLLEEGNSTVPYLIKEEGLDPLLARTLWNSGPEGELVFFGEVPEGSLLRTGTVTSADILGISHDVTTLALKENPDAALLLLFSCVGRYITLGLEATSELEHVIRALPEDLPFLACYAGGEICPVTAPDGSTVNRYHNGSFVVCALS